VDGRGLEVDDQLLSLSDENLPDSCIVFAAVQDGLKFLGAGMVHPKLFCKWPVTRAVRMI
jgi:hypothetical protein